MARPSFDLSQEVDLKVKWHNETQEKAWDGIDCPHCLNRGTIAEASVEHGVKYLYLRQCRCMIQRKINTMLEKSGLGQMIQSYTLDNYQPIEPWQVTIKKTAMSYISGAYKAYWFYIGGKVGSGKSHICTAITSEIIKKGNEGIYIRWRDFLHQIKAVMNTDEYETIMKFYRRVPVLYIDDFLQGDGKPTQADMNIAYELIDYRYTNIKTTIFSSEWALSNVIELMEGLGSRIKQLCEDFSITVANDDSRNQRFKKRGK